MISEDFALKDGRIARRVCGPQGCAESFVASPPWFLSSGSGNGADALAHAWWASLLRGERVTSASTGELRSVDLFSSVGGLSLGARLAAEGTGLTLTPALAIDIDAEALSVYQRNFGDGIGYTASIAGLVDYDYFSQGAAARLKYEPELTDSRLQGIKDTVDLVLAGPPCQGHSNLNNHTRRDDPRNRLFTDAAMVAVAMGAKMIVIENVPDVLRDRSEVVATTSALLAELGYHVSNSVLSGVTLGAPQTRKRHFTIATLAPHVGISTVEKGLRRSAMPLSIAIGDLESIESDHFLDEVPNLSEENKRRIEWLFANEAYELTNSERPDCHKDGHTYPAVYGRMHWDNPAPTITTGFMSPGRGRYIHPTQKRVITPHEAARLQGFPDWFEFSANGKAPSKKLIAKWIGDAVPSQLGYVAVLTALSSW